MYNTNKSRLQCPYRAKVVSQNVVKNGLSYGKQRYKCKSCGLNFVLGDKRVKYGSQDKLKVLKLYLENCGIRSIERLTGIRNSQISLWIEEYASKIREELTKSAKAIKSIKDVSIVEIDELCTYVKKTRNGGEYTFIWIAAD